MKAPIIGITRHRLLTDGGGGPLLWHFMDVQLIKLLKKECIAIALNARSCFIIISANTL